MEAFGFEVASYKSINLVLSRWSWDIPGSKGYIPRFLQGTIVLGTVVAAAELDGRDSVHAPPPKNMEQDIYEYVDRKNKDTFFTTNLL